MDIVHTKGLEPIPPPLKHRGTGLAFKDLFHGDPGTPENYYFTVARQGAFFSPVHRHNFDQFRFAIKGDVSLAPDMLLKEGELSYHPEGVYYGPQEDGEGERMVLVLQFGGASGQGYLSYDELARGQEALKQKGKFEGGKYYPNGTDGDANGELQPQPKDGFEALWEYYNGRPLVYPAPRFDRTILLKPANFAWTDIKTKSADGSSTGHVYKKFLGAFTERGTQVELIKVEGGGRFEIDSGNAIHLVYVLSGQGAVEPSSSATNGTHEAGSTQKTVEAESSFRLRPHSGSVLLSSSTRIEVIHFVLPLLATA